MRCSADASSAESAGYVQDSADEYERRRYPMTYLDPDLVTHVDHLLDDVHPSGEELLIQNKTQGLMIRRTACIICAFKGRGERGMALRGSLPG